ncbi:MAG: CcoQ/FixQ family Cbb3-type cytochrome c oxidase assembly chaperone [Sphingobacteriales bacterium]|jgi:cytochrome c oxidase cbb3-type subunit 3|nr:MAG: CcoQ/FixQ family Cbb3-type cytochrome c oxidase assembly chaperone [Sphingobacteriales bacterium]
MKFINYLESISGVGIFPLFSLLVFFSFFLMCVIYVIRADDNVMDEMKNIPLEESK